jgi:hypothetical protein
MSWAVLLTNLATVDIHDAVQAIGLSRSEQARLRSLRSRDVSDWGWLARRRAKVHRLTSRPAYLDDLLREPTVVRSGISALTDYAIDLTSRPGIAEIYVSTGTLRHITETYRLRLDDTHNLIVHELDDQFTAQSFVLDRTIMTAATVAVDLIESGEPRARRAGLHALGHLTRNTP